MQAISASVPLRAETPSPARTARLDSVDLVRGLIMVVMALDHVRDEFTNVRFHPEDLSHTYAALFFTRWITHFCAPGFFFLAGVGAFLSKKRGPELSRFLVTRGVWLVFVEIVLVPLLWNFGFAPVGTLQTIWALGLSMMALAALIRLPPRALAAFAVTLILFHNTLDRIRPEDFGSFKWLWILLHSPAAILYSDNPRRGFFALYSLIPWIGVMAAGYSFGPVFRMPRERRRSILLGLGTSMIAAFVLLRATNWYGNPPLGFGLASPGPFATQKTLELTVISFFNVEKYPPSLQYLLMTLGPLLLLLAAFERADARQGLASGLVVYGRVPMFYYLCHFFTLHVLAIAVAASLHQRIGVFFGAHRLPPEYGHSLPFVYAMWAVTVLLLYFPCRWYADFKRRRTDWWLSYI